MSTTLAAVRTEDAATTPQTGDWAAQIHARYLQMLREVRRDAVGNQKTHERRTEPRIPLRIPVLLHPAIEVDDRLLATTPVPIQGMAQDFSRRGIGIQYDEPFAEELVIAEFDAMRNGCISCVVRIRWRQRKSFRYYLGGGEILRWLPGEDASPAG